MGLIAKPKEIKEQLDSSGSSNNESEDESLGSAAPSRQEPNSSDPKAHHESYA